VCVCVCVYIYIYIYAYIYTCICMHTHTHTHTHTQDETAKNSEYKLSYIVTKSKKFARNMFIIGQAYLTVDGCLLDHSCNR